MLEFYEGISSTSSESGGLNQVQAQSFIRKSLKTLEIIRSQVTLIGESQGPHEILYFTYMTFLVTLVIFMTLSPLSRGEEVDGFSSFENFSGLLFGMHRLYLRAHYSDQITLEASEIVDRIRLKRSTLVDC